MSFMRFAPAVLAFALIPLVSNCGGGDSTKPAAPTVALTAPSDGATVSGTVVLRATGSNCDRVRFLVDDTSVGEDADAPYEFAWNTGAVQNGAHTVTVRGEGGGGVAEDAVSVMVNNAAGAVIVSVSPPSATLAVGATQQFTAQVTGTANTAVTWSVEGGVSRGSISVNGLYTAPPQLPNPPSATVRATSQADPQKSATATVTLTGGGGGGVTAAEEALALELFNLAHEVSVLGVDAVSLGAEAVWGASELKGSATLTGTLTQSAPGSETWNYAAQPADRLIVAFAGGPTLEFHFTVFDGYTEGSWEDFVDAHQLDFTLRDGGSLNLRVVSDRHYVSGAEVPYTWKSEWSRTVTGTAPYAGLAHTVGITHTGTQQGYNEPGYAGLENEERILGTASAAGASYSLDEYWWTSYLHNSNVGHVVRNWQMTVNSGATLGGVAYAYDTASARWEASSLLNDPGAVNSVREPDYWRVMGTFKKNGAAFGTVQFDGPVVQNTNGPNLVLAFPGGRTIVLHSLVPGPGEKPGTAGAASGGPGIRPSFSL